MQARVISQQEKQLSVLQSKATCRKRAEYNLELARYDFELPPTLEDEEIEVYLQRQMLWRHGSAM